MTYLGAQVSGSRIRIKDLKFIEERSLKHMDGWQGGSMSLAGRKVLIDSSSNGIYTYYMSFFLKQDCEAKSPTAKFIKIYKKELCTEKEA
jgi:hypothetical protein